MKVSIEYSKNAKDQVSVKIEGRDLWEGNVTLSRVIYPFLKKYRNLYKGKNPMTGYPMDFSADPCKPEGPDNPDRFEEWLLCLDKMIYSFEFIAKEKDVPGTKEFHKQCRELLKSQRKALNKLAKEDDKRFTAAGESAAFESLEWNRESEILRPAYDAYFKKNEEHDKKIQEGLDLFAKHFGSLWT